MDTAHAHTTCEHCHGPIWLDTPDQQDDDTHAATRTAQAWMHARKLCSWADPDDVPDAADLFAPGGWAAFMDAAVGLRGPV